MRMPLVPALAASLSLLAAVSSFADTVYLTNGKSFQDVVAQVSDTQVRIQMPGGEIRVPRASVERVEPKESAYASFLERRAALGRASGAKDWLMLARWAAANGLDQGARETALRAAQLDPHLEGLASLLRGFGYVYDRDLDRYVSYADEMHRRGLVNDGGVWISRQEQAEQRQAREEDRERQAAFQAAEAARAASDAERQLAELQINQQQGAGGEGVDYSGYTSPYGVTLGVFPGFYSSATRLHHGRGQSLGGFANGGHRGGGVFGGLGGLGGRVPGSLLPPSSGRRH